MAEPWDQGGEPPVPPERNRARDVKLVATGVVGVLLVWFALANLQEVSIRFWVSSARAPLIVVIIIAGALGAGVAGIASRVSRRRSGADKAVDEPE